MTETRGKFRELIDDEPGDYDRHLFTNAMALARIEAVQELAQVFGALGVLTVAEALAEIERLSEDDQIAIRL